MCYYLLFIVEQIFSYCLIHLVLCCSRPKPSSQFPFSWNSCLKCGLQQMTPSSAAYVPTLDKEKIFELTKSFYSYIRCMYVRINFQTLVCRGIQYVYIIQQQYCSTHLRIFLHLLHLKHLLWQTILSASSFSTTYTFWSQTAQESPLGGVHDVC